MTAGPAYRLILPPGFVLLRVRAPDLAAEVRDVVNRAYGKGLDDRTRGRLRRVEASLVDALRIARERGAVDVVLPLGTPWRLPVSLALVFAPVRSAEDDDAGPSATRVATRAGEAVRSVVDHVRDDPAAIAFPVALPAHPPGGALRTVHHVWTVPGTAGGGLVGTFTVSGAPDVELGPLVDELTELGDTIMASVRWSRGTVDGVTEPSTSTEGVA